MDTLWLRSDVMFTSRIYLTQKYILGIWVNGSLQEGLFSLLILYIYFLWLYNFFFFMWIIRFYSIIIFIDSGDADKAKLLMGAKASNIVSICVI